MNQTPLHADRQGDSMLRQAVHWAALGTLLWGGWRVLVRTHRQRLAMRPAALPDHLQDWEGEGGRPDPQPSGGDAGERADPSH